ncbi:hypothetical protein ACIBEA_32765 [Streptomyces sp. NPDC051555]|uniref:pPIWI_RE_Z domain-containing protein n=1 Tax=Streptomyces sp. NPDC051555 TaxID=3365657 RepID=UPI0037B64817
MRDVNGPLYESLSGLARFSGLSASGPELRDMCQVEIGLHFQQRLMPGSPATHAWVLFSGYPFASAWGVGHPQAVEQQQRVARHSLWTLGRRRAWRDALERYQKLAPALRGFDVTDPDRPAVRREVSVAGRRWQDYDEVLRVAPPLAGVRPAQAGEGTYAFPLSRSMAVVDLPQLPQAPLIAHDVDRPPPGGGEPLTFTLGELIRTAAWMDTVEDRQWAARLAPLVLSVRTAAGFEPSDSFTVDGVQHLLGIVGSGKSTLRDVIAVHLATRCAKRTTVVVSDVADVLKLTKLYNVYTGNGAAPILGAAGRERHAQRLHRRLAGQGEHRLLAHTDSSFAYLSSACTLNALRRGDTGGDVLGFGEAPCNNLHAPSRRAAPGRRDRRDPDWQKESVSCPLWSSCPRHHAARELVSADIWVTTPAGLVDAEPPRPQNGERIRYLELACRRSDLVIVDEADRVQMQLDQMFAPAVLLAGTDEEGFIDKLSGHKIRELSVGGRIQLSDRDVENFIASLNTATQATDRLFAMLVADHGLRSWVRTGYFSAWTLQLGLLDERYPPADASNASTEAQTSAREALGKKLDAFRDNPFGDRRRSTTERFADLTELLNAIMHTNTPEHTRRQLMKVMDRVFAIDKNFLAAKRARYAEQLAARERKSAERRAGSRRYKKDLPLPQSPDEWHAEMGKRFEFTLLLAALEPKLALINAMWPRVEAALNLGFNSMYRRPVDYAPVVPEAPMGNVLGFQFQVEGQDEGGIRSGELKFFRCSGVGRELLRAMPKMAAADGRPGAHVLLMSASSWAGRSSRYHVPVEVGVVIQPPAAMTERLARESTMRFEFIEEDGEYLRVSGTDPEDRPEKLRRIARWLGAGIEQGKEHGGPLERELREVSSRRDQILLLVGSYEEARVVADTLHNLNSRWKDRVLRLVSDDEEFEDEPHEGGQYARTLRRGDVERLRDSCADVLVAPLLAVERGHNILNEDDVAAIGTVYFLARPNPHPHDLMLAVYAINDWIVRAVDGGDFERWVRSGSTVDEGADEVRRQARARWYQVLQRSMAWSRLGDERVPVTWDLLVLMWQVIGRLVRGGVPARVVFVDAAFAPRRAADPPSADDHESSLLHSVLAVLRPYFTDGTDVPPDDRFIVHALYAPLWQMLGRCLHPAESA